MLNDVATTRQPADSQQLLEKYNRSGPRYTSYPTALELQSGLTDKQLSVTAHRSGKQALALYFHIPFCHELCHYCACNKTITRNKDKLTRYLSFLMQELAYKSALLPQKPVAQIHFGGGTPNSLSTSQLDELLDVIRAVFTVQSNAEISIELDPRLLEPGDLLSLRQSGFTRISMGIQDFDPQVQQAINREQCFEMIEKIMVEVNQAQFHSVNFDLVFGLPHQSLDTIRQTLRLITELNPDRLSVFNYAHMPHRFAAQRKIKDQWLPNAHTKRQMHLLAQRMLAQAGYQHIGMDHFAKPEDSLCLAQQEKRLYRNFQGYSEFGNVDLIGFGITAISQVGDVIVQNVKSLTSYYATLDAISNQVSCNLTEKGIELSFDDLIRAEVIQQLICGFSADIEGIEAKFHSEFHQYFAEEMALLYPMEQDGLITLQKNKLSITEAGKPFVRTICMCFDAYLPKYRKQTSFSQVV